MLTVMSVQCKFRARCFEKWVLMYPAMSNLNRIIFPWIHHTVTTMVKGTIMLEFILFKLMCRVHKSRSYFSPVCKINNSVHRTNHVFYAFINKCIIYIFSCLNSLLPTVSLIYFIYGNTCPYTITKRWKFIAQFNRLFKPAVTWEGLLCKTVHHVKVYVVPYSEEWRGTRGVPQLSDTEN